MVRVNKTNFFLTHHEVTCAQSIWNVNTFLLLFLWDNDNFLRTVKELAIDELLMSFICSFLNSILELSTGLRRSLWHPEADRKQILLVWERKTIQQQTRLNKILLLLLLLVIENKKLENTGRNYVYVVWIVKIASKEKTVRNGDNTIILCKAGKRLSHK